MKNNLTVGSLEKGSCSYKYSQTFIYSFMSNIVRLVLWPSLNNKGNPKGLVLFHKVITAGAVCQPWLFLIKSRPQGNGCTGVQLQQVVPGLGKWRGKKGWTEARAATSLAASTPLGDSRDWDQTFWKCEVARCRLAQMSHWFTNQEKGSSCDCIVVFYGLNLVESCWLGLSGWK